jgi:cytochrome c peroxidase
MKPSYSLPIALFIVVLALPSCEFDKTTNSVEYYTPDEYHTLTQTLDLPSVPYNYGSSNFQDFGFAPGDAEATLGRVLFYDKNLSADNSVSCASCHKQDLAFADDAAFSTGIFDRLTSRNSLSLGAFQSFGSYSDDPLTTLFWDGRVNSLHDQMVQTIRNPKEMGMELEVIAHRIEDIDHYKILFTKAFGSQTINKETILSALESFMKSIRSSSSKFDEAAKHMNFTPNGIVLTGLSATENMGLKLFTDNCFSCHSQGLDALQNFNQFVSPVRSANNGLDLVYADKGEGEFNPSPSALAIFKVPGLRNVELTAPYMHDGRFSTLEDVVNFYSENIQNHPNLNPLLKENNQPKKFNFTASEKDALVQFLKTLTDHTMTGEVKWSDPFL